MKSKKYPFSIILLMIGWFGILNAATIPTGEIELSKSYTKTFPANDQSVLDLSNRYGKIDIQTWSSPSVKIDVKVIVKANNKSNAQDKLDEIQVSMSTSGNSIVAVTNITSSNTSWWEGWWSDNSRASMEINYTVFMPSNLKSIIENKYGNIYLADLIGKTSINLKYGNLEARDIKNDLLIDLSYGNATVGSVLNLKGNLSYSDYRGTAATNVILTTKYSKVYLDGAKSYVGSSKYDDIKLGKIETLTFTGAYDDIEIDQLGSGTFDNKYCGTEINSLSHSLTADIKYGSIKIDNLKTSFKNITISTSYAPVKIYGTVATKIDVSGSYFEANLGADFIQKSKDKNGSSLSIQGYKLSERTSSAITIKSKYADVLIK